MKQLLKFLNKTSKGIQKASSRFPLTVISLILATGFVWYTIWLDRDPGLWVQKAIFIILFSAVIGVATQFLVERFSWATKKRIFAYGAALIVVILYGAIIAPAPTINFTVGIRTTVAIFATISLGIYIPAHRGEHDFNRIALVHFTSFFTSVLYAGVLSLGISAIITAVDILLFSVNYRTYGYILSTVWIMFAPLYYLSLLPRFSSKAQEDVDFTHERETYPKILNILVSYIAIPLIASYTAVLFAYMIRIIISLTWPVGQLGPLVLGFGLAGLIIYVLASSIDNQFTRLYQRWFPPVLIPVVIVQMIAVGIRLNAYGFTESRYYLMLFGIFFIVVGIVLTLKPIVRNQWIALIAAVFALVSVIPPIDAFSVSKQAQISRLNTYLEAEGLLVGGQLQSSVNVQENTQREITSIMSYLYWREYHLELNYLKDDFDLYRDFKTSFGFDMYYGQPIDSTFFYANLDRSNLFIEKPHDVFLIQELYRYSDQTSKNYALTHEGQAFDLNINRLNETDVVLSLTSSSETILEVNLYELALDIQSNTGGEGKLYTLEELSSSITKDRVELTIIFFFIGLEENPNTSADYDVAILVKFLD